jgi:hypothetical protein
MLQRVVLQCIKGVAMQCFFSFVRSLKKYCKSYFVLSSTLAIKLHFSPTKDIASLESS